LPSERTLRIIAQDPVVKGPDGKILTAKVDIPSEQLGPGPLGYRVFVVAYDAAQRVLYESADLGNEGDCFASSSDRDLLSDPAFHAQNVYAIVMRLLARFEAALGRRVAWSFGGHQLHIAPHAMAEANAFYSEEMRSLLFGYFVGRDGGNVFTCLSHDIVAHETTHALLDGLRTNYTLPSGPDQAAFHEGFADIVALLSVFGLRETVETILWKERRAASTDARMIDKTLLTEAGLREGALLGLAEQFGQEASQFRDDVLRRSVKKPPPPGALQDPAYEECHVRGEILAAAVLNAFIAVWRRRLDGWLPKKDASVKVDRVAEDGADAAEHLLTMAIRALDYCPVVDITFGDFFSALLTADRELVPDDGRYKYRAALREQFARWHIDPAADDAKEQGRHGEQPEPGCWGSPTEADGLRYDCVHRESLERDPDEVFRFLWENRGALGLFPDAYTQVLSVRPCVRVAPDGFVLRETVSEYMQSVDLEAGNLKSLGVKKPEGMPDDTDVRLTGGGVLVFDGFGRLKYHVRKRLNNEDRQTKRLDYLWPNRIVDGNGRYGYSDGAPAGMRFALVHRRRAGRVERGGGWDG